MERGDGQRTPFEDELRGHLVLHPGNDRRARANDAEVDEESAIAVFGERGELADSINGNPRRFERLDERISKPLRKLVKGHGPLSVVAGACGTMRPGIADRVSVNDQRGGPNRGEAVK